MGVSEIKTDQELIFLVKLYKIYNNKTMFRNYFFPLYFNKFNMKTNHLSKTDLVYELLGYSVKKSNAYKIINSFIKEGVFKSCNGIDIRNTRSVGTIYGDFYPSVDKMLEKGYDVIILDYTNGRDYIQRNGSKSCNA